MADETCTKEGWFVLNDSRVWCGLSPSTLSIFEKPQDKKPKLVLPLQQVKYIDTVPSRPNSFLVNAGKSSVILEAKNRIVMEDWVVGVRKELAACLNAYCSCASGCMCSQCQCNVPTEAASAETHQLLSDY
eukprot:TRINITY_DN7072_c0_g1_i2.p1 TRINITY_DN7072_c0_g1~~TRINITY_DN7072_c0_g1_i2.p1  ORF type:complete len:131 (-),score=12.16 TRINITY_DN7072_c0_g1_i2:323-715(-)